VRIVVTKAKRNAEAAADSRNGHQSVRLLPNSSQHSGPRAKHCTVGARLQAPAAVALSNSSAESAHFKKAVRATVILFPLLGVTNLLFFINPKNGTHDKIYMLFNASMQSSQV